MAIRVEPSARALKRAKRVADSASIVSLEPSVAPHVEQAFRHDALTINGTPKRGHDTNLKPAMKRTNPERQDPARQIQLLKAKIEKDLKAIASLVTHGRMDKAALTASMVATARNRILFLTEQLASAPLEADKPEQAPAATMNKVTFTRTERKVHRNKRWSNK